MKKFTKLFLLALCTWFLFLWFSHAQRDFHYETIEIDSWCSSYQCDFSPQTFLVHILLIWIWIILCLLLIFLSIKTIILYKKFNTTHQKFWLSHIPVLNIYLISKITIGKIRFFILTLLLLFFVYSIYTHIDNNKCCFDEPSRQEYSWIIIWFISIIILSVLLSKLNISKFTNLYKKSSNE